MAYNPMYDAPVVATPADAPMMVQQTTSPMMYDNPAVAREVAQVQGQIIIAKKFPRDEAEALKKIDRACSRPTLANSAIYNYSRGGAEVTGASIRLAEELAKDWGNIKSGYEPIDSNDNETTVRCYAYDMEANTINEITIKVPHVRYSKKGGVVKLTDPRDIYETIANQASRRVRACILKTIPGDIVDHALEVCRKTQISNVNITPENLDKLCEAFASYGVAKIQIEAFIQRNLESVTIDQYLRLRQIYQGLTEGVSRPENYFKTIEEAMAERGEAPKTEPVQEKPKAKVEKKEEAPAPKAEEAVQSEDGDENLPGFDF